LRNPRTSHGDSEGSVEVSEMVRVIAIGHQSPGVTRVSVAICKEIEFCVAIVIGKCIRTPPTSPSLEFSLSLFSLQSIKRCQRLQVIYSLFHKWSSSCLEQRRRRFVLSSRNWSHFLTRRLDHRRRPAKRSQVMNESHTFLT
jgi:hypothetical protein